MVPRGIGIDLGSRAVRLAWVSASRRGRPQWHWEERPQGSSDEPGKRAQILHELLRPLRAYRFVVPVVTTLPQSHIRLLSLQAPSAKQLSDAVQEQLPTLFPIEIDTAQVAYRLVGQQSENAHRCWLVQVAACDRELLRQARDRLWRIGWIASHIYPTAYALTALAKTQNQLDQDPALLLEFGAAHLSIGLLANQQVILTREVTPGSDALTEALMKQVNVGQRILQLSWEDAERLKCQTGIPDPSPGHEPSPGLSLTTYQAMIQPVLEQWLEEIKRTVAFGLHTVQPATRIDVTPRKILVGGGGGQLAGLDRWLGEQLGLPVQAATVKSLLLEERPSLAVACGLLYAHGAEASSRPQRRGPRPASDAPRAWSGRLPRQGSINLLPEAAQGTRRLLFQSRLAIRWIVVVGILLWLGIGIQGLRLASLQRQTAPLEQRWRDLEPLAALVHTVAARRALVQTLKTMPSIPVTWFKTLATGFPDSVRLTELTISEKGDVALNGQARTRGQMPEAYVAELGMWLEQAQLCQGAHLTASQRNQADLAMVDFKLICKRP